MDLTPEQSRLLREQLALVFWFLRLGGRAKVPRESDDANAAGKPEVSLSQALSELITPKTTIAAHRNARSTYRRALDNWPGLGDTPIVVMTNLAPGADTLAAHLASEKRFQNAGFHVRAPLPFPPDLYRDASTFVRTKRGVPLEGNVQRQEGYDQVLTAVGRDRAFFVQLASDCGKGPAELHKVLLADRDDRTRRHQRYYAAGEHLAVYAHLLIAVWNGERETNRAASGTAAVVEARLRGPRAGVLPTSHGVRLAHGGPLLHLFATRADQTRPANAGGDVVDAAAKPSPPAFLRLLHPYEVAGEDPAKTPLAGWEQVGLLEPSGTRPEQLAIRRRNAKALHVQRDRISLFCRTAENLSTFVGQPPSPTPENRNNEFVNMLTCEEADGTKHKYADRIRALRMSGSAGQPDDSAPAGEEGAFSHALHVISDLRCKASQASRTLKTSHDRTIRLLFVLTFLAALSLHVFAHWHPQHPSPDIVAAPAAHAHDPENSGAENSGAHAGESEGPAGPADGHAHFSWPRALAGSLALGLAVCGLLYFGVRHSQQDAERAHDYRALAEGLRVQFYWNLAGCGRSVSANYMQRQRSELDWIRAAIRSLVFPYDQWRQRFDRLRPADQVTVLHCVRRCWIERQRNYFEGTWQTYHHLVHAVHKLGGALALAGVATAAACVANVWDGRSLAALAAGWPWMLLLAVAIWTSVMAVCRFARDYAHADRDQHHHAPLWIRCTGLLVPAPESHVTVHLTQGLRATRLVVGFAGHLPLALLQTAVALQVCTRLSVWQSLPSADDWGIILGGGSLVGGALMVAWAEKNLLSELAYQYNTMHTLFRAAAQRVASDLSELESRLDEPEQFRSKLLEIQSYLYALGKESLDENAEWLLLHRARPLEPVMAG